MWLSAVSKQQHMLSWDAAHLCVSHTHTHIHRGSLTHCKQRQVCVTETTHLSNHKVAPWLFPPQILLSRWCQRYTQHYFWNRWQEAAAASSNSKWAVGLFIYDQLCPESINHLHLSAFWLRCHSRPDNEADKKANNEAANTRLAWVITRWMWDDGAETSNSGRGNGAGLWSGSILCLSVSLRAP